MVRSDEQRSKAYKRKLNGDVIRNRINNERKRMIAEETDYFISAAETERMVKTFLSGTSSLNLVYYIIFAKEIQSVVRTHIAGPTVLEEMEILQNKWITRGLDGTLLDGIKKMIVPNYMPPPYFLMDISLLDGASILA